MVIAVAGEFGDELPKFVYYRVEGGRVKEQEEVSTPPGGVPALAGQLVGLEVDLLIAGRVPRELELALFDAGINLISGVSGRADRILSDYLSGELRF